MTSKIKAFSRLRISGMLAAAAAAAVTAAGAGAGAAQAEETLRYSYDARGRLVAAFRSSGPKAGVRTRYGYDAADNRNSLRIDEVQRFLSEGEALFSQNRRFFLIMQLDGNLVLYRDAWVPLWSTSTFGSGHRALFQPDANLVVYGSDWTSLWASHSNGHWGGDLTVENDGNLVIRDVTGKTVWTTGTGGH
jgi:hypothetical protein